MGCAFTFESFVIGLIDIEIDGNGELVGSEDAFDIIFCNNFFAKTGVDGCYFEVFELFGVVVCQGYGSPYAAEAFDIEEQY